MFESLKQEIINNPKSLIIAITIIGILLIMIGHVYRDSLQSTLKQKVMTLPEADVDLWSVSHILFYMACGFIIPNYPITFLGIGVGFEMFEDFMSADDNTQLANCKQSCDANGCKRPNTLWCNGVQDGYWYGKWDDVLFNVLGYIAGSSIRTTFVDW